MNKIYKVIWSRTRNCYVAVAEFVKRSGKGSSLNRRHIAAALAAVAICAAPAGALANSGGHWDGSKYIGDAPEYNVSINEEVNGIAYGRYTTDASGATLSIVTGGKVKQYVTGGHSDSGNASQNAVTISGGMVNGGAVGGIARAGDAIGNTVTISGGTVEYGGVTGGYSEFLDAKDNTVTISGGTVGTDVYGGHSERGKASQNAVTISGGTVGGDVYGGLGGHTTEKNAVSISGGEVNGTVYGGRSADGNASQNTVTISGGTVGSDVYGGFGGHNAEGNTVTISSGTVNGNVYGGVSGLFSTTGNTVILSRQGIEAPPDINGTLFGGFSKSGGTVLNNTLQVEAVGLSAPEIQNFENYRFVLPSDVKKGDTMLTLKGQGADLTIDGTKVDMAVAKDGGLNIGFGESVTLLHKTGGTGAFNVENVTGAVQTSKLDGVSTGFDVMKYKLDKPDHEDKLNVTVSELHLYGDGGTNTPGQRETGNTLIINSGKASVAFGGRASSGAVTGNNVKMTDGEIVRRGVIQTGNINVSGSLFGGFADAGNAEKNTVEISGGTVNSSVYGGHSANGNAANNTVTISGGTVNNDVYGGWSFDGDATNNTVILSRQGSEAPPDINGTLFGGYSEFGGTVSNNTLQVEAVGLSAPEIQNFENYRFVLPSDVKKGDTMLTLKEQGADLTIDGTKVDMAGTKDGGLNIDFGESVTLLHKKDGSGTFKVENLTGAVQTSKLDGVSNGFDVMKYTLDKPANEDKLNVTVSELHLYGDGGTNTPGQRETGNTLTITGGKADVAFGGRAATGAVTENKVIMTGGEILKENRIDIENEYAGNINVSGMLFGGFAEDGKVEKNTVEISGGTVNSWVIGGFSWNGDATNNTVILSKEKEAPVLNGTLFGGYGNGTISNNTLQVEAVGLSAPEIQNFDNYTFVLPSDVKKGDTMLTLKDQSLPLDIDGTKVDMAVAKGSGLNIGFGESVTLLHKTGGEGAFSVTNLTGEVQTSKLDGVSTGFDVMKYKLDKPANEDKLDVTVSELYLYGDGGTNTPGQRQTGNTLTITGGKANVAFGGRAATGDVTGNKVEMTGGEIVDLKPITIGNINVSGMLIGGFADTGNVEKNTVELSGGTVNSWLIGGHAEKGEAKENSVTVSGGDTSSVHGGHSYNGAATNNTVTVSGGKVTDLSGGYSPFGDATGNTVTISGGKVGSDVCGGRSNGGNAVNNTVTIEGGTVGKRVYGGRSADGNASQNTVTISGGTVNNDVYGGYSGRGDATNNTVTISGGTVNNDVYGGYSVRGAATDNTVILSRQGSEAPPDINGTLFGGFSYAGGTVSNNTLQVEAVGLSAPEIRKFDNYRFVLPKDIKAGDTMLTLKSQINNLEIDAAKVSVSSNVGKTGLNLDESVTLLHKTGGEGAFSVTNLTGAVQTSKLDGEAGGFDVMKYTLDKPANEDKLNVAVSELFLYGDGGTNTPGQREMGNTLNITSGKANAAFGGRASSGAVTGNKVEMSGGEIVRVNTIWIGIRNVSGDLYGGFADAGNVEKNTVKISDGTVKWSVFGGYSLTSGIAIENSVTVSGGTVGSVVHGGYSQYGDVAKNTVTISGGEVKGSVYGGYSYKGNAENNTVILSKEKEAPVLNGTLFGGLSDGDGAVSGNTLQVEATGLSAPEIQNFDNYRFVLPDGSKKGDVLLSLNKQDADLTIDGRKVSVSMTGSTVADIGLKLDESVTLLEKTGGNGTFTVDNTYLAVHEKPLDDVAGGLPVDIYRVTASEDTLNVTYTEHYLYGDGGTNTTGQRETGNTLTITSGKATAGFGGRASSGDVTENKVEMSGGELVYDTLYADIQGSLYGGLTDKGNANHNTVTVSGGKLKERVACVRWAFRWRQCSEQHGNHSRRHSRRACVRWAFRWRQCSEQHGNHSRRHSRRTCVRRVCIGRGHGQRGEPDRHNPWTGRGEAVRLQRQCSVPFGQRAAYRRGKDLR